jgi:hypothetical protein
MKNTLYLFLAFSFAFISSCKKEDGTDDLKFGFIEGTVYANIPGKTISGATIYVDYQNIKYQTQSDTTGFFSLSVPVGHHQLHILTGDGKLFQTIIEIDILYNQTTTLTNLQSKLTQSGQIAFIPGSYDAIQNIITNSLGYTITPIPNNLLSSLTAMQDFDAIFINCGAPDLTDPAAFDNLAQYVTDGGSIYVSDWAVSYLTGIHTGGCSRPGGFIDDTKLCSSKSGSSVTLPGNIVAPDFQAFMGTNTMNIYYDLNEWEIIQNFDAAYWEVVVSTSGLPALMLRKSDFTNGTSQGNSGNIYFTTFHNDPNNSINQDMQHMLEFVILNL